jgi:hypothetical protein
VPHPPVAAILPILVAVAALVGVALAMRLRPKAARWPLLLGGVVLLGGITTAIVIRVIESLVIDVAVGERLREVEWVRRWLVDFGIVGPLHVLGVTAVVWPALVNYSKRDEVDPPLLAATGAAGLVIGRVILQVILARVALGSGVRLGIVALGDVALAMTWAYGLSRSALNDGRYGGTPFGRYALGTIFLRGCVQVGSRAAGYYSILALAIGVLAAIYAVFGLFRLRRLRDAPPSTRAEVGQETLRAFARAELSRGRVRPLWIVLGSVVDLGGIVLGFAAAVWLGGSAKIDFGEIDRNGPGHDAAAGLLALGVIASFPISAAIVAMASGGREKQRAYALEAGISAMISLAALLTVLGVVAPVGVALGVACAPVAFLLSAIGAHVVAGRRL